MREGPRNDRSSPERSPEELAHEWNDTAREVLEEVCNLLDTPIPARDDVQTARMLESLTAPLLERKARESSLTVISSIAGGGKSTVGAMLEQMGFQRLPRATTRPPRPGEVQGHDYEFMTREEFEGAQAEGRFAYAKETYGEGRAISKAALDRAVRREGRFYAEGDALAYHTIREEMPEYRGLSYVSIFLLPPTFEAALTRLEGRIQQDIARGANPEEARADKDARILQSIRYLKDSGAHVRDGSYDGFLVNDDLARVRGRLAQLFGEH